MYAVFFMPLISLNSYLAKLCHTCFYAGTYSPFALFALSLAFFNAILQVLMQDAAFSFANIAQRLHKSDSTISREIICNRYQV
jgi:hypothetical protein